MHPIKPKLQTEIIAEATGNSSQTKRDGDAAE